MPLKEDRRPLIAEIKRNSLDDGPGIRSVVFFKGCPLRCLWCHNPECIDAGPELLFRPAPCVGCGTCRKVCPEGAIGKAGPGGLDRPACTLCGLCARECPSGALTLVGAYHEPEQLVEELARDKPFYDNSGGGVTLSGGEPTVFLGYAGEIASRLAARGIRVCVETCGDFDWDRFARTLLPHVSLVYVDLKLADGRAHERFTGRGNSRILENIGRILALGTVEFRVRVPLVPGVTATEKNLEAIARWMRERGAARIALLPYNPLWVEKAKGLGRTLAYDRATWMTQEERQSAMRPFAGIEIEREI